MFVYVLCMYAAILLYRIWYFWMKICVYAMFKKQKLKNDFKLSALKFKAANQKPYKNICNPYDSLCRALLMCDANK